MRLQVLTKQSVPVTVVWSTESLVLRGSGSAASSKTTEDQSLDERIGVHVSIFDPGGTDSTTRDTAPEIEPPSEPIDLASSEVQSCRHHF